MKNLAERIPVSDEYIRALGRATYNFAYLEWGIIWLTEVIQRGFIHKSASMTAGQISQQFAQAIQSVSEGVLDKPELDSLAMSFKSLVKDRNSLIHGNPFTAKNSEQRLLYSGKHGRKDWTIKLILTFADDVASASYQASDLLHSGRYEAYSRTTPK